MRSIASALSRLILWSGVLVTLSSTAHAVPVTVAANAAIYNADNPTAVSSAGVPMMIVLPTATTSFTFTLGVPTQTITLNGGANFNDADGMGAAVATSTNTGTTSLSGIKSNGAGYITAVFLAASPVARPGMVDYTVLGTNLVSYTPMLQQVFFVGDGLTGDGSGIRQNFFVPTGAVMLFLGISDASGYSGEPSAYGDNFGSFTGTIDFSTRAGVPEPAPFALLAIGLFAFALGRRKR